MIAEKRTIHPDMTILDIVSKYRETEAIFKKYENRAVVCLCCKALFEPLKDPVIYYSELWTLLGVVVDSGTKH
jgi:hypothetical protein